MVPKHLHRGLYLVKKSEEKFSRQAIKQNFIGTFAVKYVAKYDLSCTSALTIKNSGYVG